MSYQNKYYQYVSDSNSIVLVKQEEKRILFLSIDEIDNEYLCETYFGQLNTVGYKEVTKDFFDFYHHQALIHLGLIQCALSLDFIRIKRAKNNTEEMCSVAQQNKQPY